MADDNASETPEEGGGSVYRGNKVPKILTFAYVAFAAWALYYLIKYLVPDLRRWLP